jgi:hypothetical protein
LKEVKIKLDDKSLEILKDVDPIHRESIINFGVRLASQTEYFKILKGELEEAEDLVSINEETKTSKKEEPAKQIEENSGIDLSDLGGF